jgi:hypothetical protein
MNRSLLSLLLINFGGEQSLRMLRHVAKKRIVLCGESFDPNRLRYVPTEHTFLMWATSDSWRHGQLRCDVGRRWTHLKNLFQLR